MTPHTNFRGHPLRVRTRAPRSKPRCSTGSASQIFAVPSELAVISSVPLKATAR